MGSRIQCKDVVGGCRRSRPTSDSRPRAYWISEVLRCVPSPSRHSNFGTEVRYDAALARRTASKTGPAPVPDQKLMSLRPSIRGQECSQIHLHIVRVVVPAKAEPLRQPANVRVHGKCVFGAEMDANDTGGLVTDAGQSFQLLAGFRNLPLMPLDKDFGGGDQIARLAAVETTALDESFQLGDFGARVALGSGIAAKQSGRDQVDSSVRALRGQDDGNQQL